MKDIEQDIKSSEIIAMHIEKPSDLQVFMKNNYYYVRFSYISANNHYIDPINSELSFFGTMDNLHQLDQKSSSENHSKTHMRCEIDFEKVKVFFETGNDIMTINDKETNDKIHEFARVDPTIITESIKNGRTKLNFLHESGKRYPEYIFQDKDNNYMYVNAPKFGSWVKSWYLFYKGEKYIVDSVRRAKDGGTTWLKGSFGTIFSPTPFNEDKPCTFNDKVITRIRDVDPELLPDQFRDIYKEDMKPLSCPFSNWCFQSEQTWSEWFGSFFY